jgi:Transposase DDE domain group 1
MPTITKKETRLKLQFVANTDQSIHAGLVAVEAMARRFGLWEKVRAIKCLDPRKDKNRGYSPEVILGQLIYAFCSGGGCLSDSEALNDDPLAKELFGVGKFADQSQVGEWLREQGDASVAALRKLLREFARWVWQQAAPGRLLHAGQVEVFFDDTQLEVNGKQFEGAAINYNGDLALSWQTLWVGPLLCDSHVGKPGDVSEQLLPMLERGAELWKGKPAHFYADSGSSAGTHLDAIAAQGWHYTVSYNKWTGPLERKAQELPAGAWKQNGEEQHAFFRHQPEGRKEPQLYAVARRRDEELFERYGFIACDEGQQDAGRVFERHHLKGDKERMFSEVLNGLDLHRPPCSALRANQVYYLIGALAYNLMVAIKLLDLRDECQGWQLKTLMKKLVFMPGRLGRHARQWVAKVLVPGTWLNWWQRWAQRVWPEHGAGRPKLSAATG